MRQTRTMRRMPVSPARRAYVDPFVSLGADRAWRAEEATDDGSLTTSLVSYVGSSTLTLAGTGQAKRAASANLNGKQAIAFSGTGSYGAVTLGGAPAAFSVVSVFRLGAGDPSAGISALTAGGAVNSGVAQLNQSGQLTARKAAVANAQAVSANANYVMVSVFDASGATLYLNKRTGVTAAGAGALAGTTFQVGALSTPGNIFAFVGEWATTGYWTRALSAGEASTILGSLGSLYGITIGA